MESIASRLAPYKIVGIDTSIFIYFLEASLRYGGLAHATISQITTGSTRGVTSAVTLMEVAVGPLKSGNPRTAFFHASTIRQMPNLFVADIDAPAARAAAGLRAKYGTRAPDALQIGACLHAGATAFVTNDKRLQTIRELEIIVLDDFIH